MAALSNSRRLWLALLVLPSLFWAGNALIARATVGEIPPLALSFWRWVGALAIILPFTARDLLASRAMLWRYRHQVLWLGVLSVAVYNTLLYLAVQTTTAINATLVGTTLPLMVLLLGRFWLDEPIRPRQAFGIVVSALGLLAVIAKGEPARLLALGAAPGDGLMLLATLSWAVYSLMLKRFPVPLRPFTLLTALMAVGVVAILPLYGWELASGIGFAPTARSIGAILYTALFASVLAYYFWNEGVVTVGAATAGQYTYLIPLFAAVLAVLLLGEEFRWFHALGAALIFIGIALAAGGRRR